MSGEAEGFSKATVNIMLRKSVALLMDGLKTEHYT